MSEQDNFAVSISFSAQVRHAGMISDLMNRLGVGKSTVCQTALERYYYEINQLGAAKMEAAKMEAEQAG